MIRLKPMATSHAEMIIVNITINCAPRNPVDFENKINSNATPDIISSRHSSIEIRSFLKMVPSNPRQNRKAAK
jgi:hypothetical protein